MICLTPSRWVLLLLLVAGIALPLRAQAQLASLRVQVGPHVITDSVMAVSLMPGERLSIRVPPSGADSISVQAPTGRLLAVSDRVWRYTAPSTPGLVRVTVRRHPAPQAKSGGRVRLHVFVLTPWDHDGTHLGGYRMGRYQPTAWRGKPRYARPDGFIQVTEANRRVKVSPHFRLEQFLCKQTEAMPQYALVQTRLLMALERIYADVRRRGHDVETLHVMSAFRTPHYNRRIGNRTSYSRHLYGDGADIFVDADGDGWMDDLNGDGRITKADATLLARWIRAGAGPDGRFIGGVGVYGPKPPHRGPFVHLDLRGFDARW